MRLLGNRVLVEKVEEEKKEGFQAVEVQDSFIYKGRIVQIGGKKVNSAAPYTISAGSGGSYSADEPDFKEGDIIIFAKYQPNTYEIPLDGKTYKVVQVSDIIGVL